MADLLRLYVDEHVSRAIVRGLRQRGIDVVTVHDAGLMGAADFEHLQEARRQGRILFSRDVDFLRLHQRGVGHAGLVYAPQETPVGEVIRGLLLICEVLSSEEMENHVEFL